MWCRRDDVSGLCFHKTHDTFDERCLAGTIGSKQCKNRTRRYIEWDIMEECFLLTPVCRDGFGETIDAKYWIHEDLRWRILKIKLRYIDAILYSKEIMEESRENLLLIFWLRRTTDDRKICEYIEDELGEFLLIESDIIVISAW